jgi:hypothetical protein
MKFHLTIFEWKEKKPRKKVVPSHIASKQATFPALTNLVLSSDTITVVSLFQSPFKAASLYKATNITSPLKPVKLTRLAKLRGSSVKKKVKLMSQIVIEPCGKGSQIGGKSRILLRLKALRGGQLNQLQRE